MAPGKQAPRIWKGQGHHFFWLFTLLFWVVQNWRAKDQPFPLAFWIAVAFPVVHQVFVWLAWRMELRSSFTSRLIGFRGYVVVFFILFLGRFVSLVNLAWLDRGSLGMWELPRVLLTVVLVALGLYAMFSVMRYFGMARAAGADHFDSKYREMPLVKKGIFRFTNNGMYLCGFLLFWAIALGFDSSAALVVAMFSHFYIWIHYYATEEPDMEFLYGGKTGGGDAADGSNQK